MSNKAAPLNDAFSDAAAAHAKVKATISDLRAEYDATNERIDETSKELDRQLRLYLPADEMKRAILEILSANAKRFEKELRAGICDFIMHKHGDALVPIDVRMSGKPMVYSDVEAIISGEYSSYRFTNLLKAGNEPYVFDAPLFAYFEATVSERLAGIMVSIDPDEMGYAKVSNGEIGSGIKERREIITRLKQLIESLTQYRDDTVAKLFALGYAVQIKPNRQG